jgi:hypothetical protein
MTQSSTDSSLVERLLGYAESGFATDHKTDCAAAAYELVALAADRDAAREVYLTLQQSNAVLASQHSARAKVRLYLHTYLDLQYDTGMTVRELAKEVVKRNRRMGCVAPSDGLLVTIAEALDEFSL